MKMYRIVGTAIAFAVDSGALAQYSVPFATVVLKGDRSFGPYYETFVQLTAPTINAQGLVAFTGLTAAPGLNRTGLFGWADGTGFQVARQGDSLPNHPSLTYHSFSPPVVNDVGAFAFHARYSSGNFSSAIVTGHPGQLTLVALGGADPNPDPDPPYVRFPGFLGNFEVPVLSHTGHIAFAPGETAVRQVWAGLPDAMELHAATGNPAPGYPSGTEINNLAALVRVTGDGQSLFTASISSGGTALLQGSPQGMSMIAGPGQPTPDVPGVFTSLSPNPTINAGGVVRFRGLYQNQGGQSTVGVWIGSPGNFQQIASLSEFPAGLPAGSQFTDFSGAPVVTRSGNAVIAAAASVPGQPSVQGVWTWNSGSLSLLARTGDPIVNLASNITWSEFGGGSSEVTEFAVNDRSQIAFLGRLHGFGTFTYGLLATDLDGDLVSVVRTNQSFEVAPGDVRTVTEISLYGPSSSGFFGMNGDDGSGTIFNDRGQLAFMLEFTDGSLGIFVATVPAPTAACMLLFGSLRSRRRSPGTVAT